MRTTTERAHKLEALGFSPSTIHWNLSSARLYEHALRRQEGVVAEHGPLVCDTGQFTGRSPNDRFLVREPASDSDVWWGSVNRPIEPDQFEAVHRLVRTYLDGAELYVQDCYVGAAPQHRLPIRIVTERAWHSLFARTMFISEADPAILAQHDPQFTVVAVPGCEADPAEHGTHSSTFILLNFASRLVLIGGTSYAGEIKKSIFSVMNYLMPTRRVMPMHCSANVGLDDDVALFFGLSGTGKTTLSSDPDRRLIGDDEHGWSDHGVFNCEGGCYAKTIRLSPEAEPEIYSTTRRFGTVLENVTIDPETRVLDLDDASYTENTRAAYPLSHIAGSVPSAAGGHPHNIVMLTADAFGVLPPTARLTEAGAMYHFLSGYTAKVTGTERGLSAPTATFSTCFGAPFMVHRPAVYAQLLGEKIARHQVKVWLVNTGWTGGPPGRGTRMQIDHTRAMIRVALSGALDGVAYEHDSVFNLDVPAECPGVPTDVLMPGRTWSDSASYDAQASTLARMFVDNFAEVRDSATAEVQAAGPRA